MESQAALPQHQISLWHTLNIPILLHHPPGAPRSLCKDSSTEGPPLSRGWKDPNRFSQHILYMHHRNLVSLHGTQGVGLCRAVSVG